MYVPDQQATGRYRDAIVAMGFSDQHASLVQVDVAAPRSGPRPSASPLYRITTGIDVVRRGETVRRVLMLWYVYNDGGILEETQDRDSLADMVCETVSLLPGEKRRSLPAPTGWAAERTPSASPHGQACRAA